MAVQGNQVVKVKLTATGDITADGQRVTLEELAAKFADRNRAGGEVWYYREHPASEPHPNAMKVIDLLATTKLPAKLSAKPDFSDAIDDKGISRPAER